MMILILKIQRSMLLEHIRYVKINSIKRIIKLKVDPQKKMITLILTISEWY